MCSNFVRRFSKGQSAAWVFADAPDGVVEGSPSKESPDSDSKGSLLLPGSTPLASAIGLPEGST